MGAAVDRTLKAIESTGVSKQAAIRIAKSRGLIKQAGKHLAKGKKSKLKGS